MKDHEPSAEEINDELYVSPDEQRMREVAHNEIVESFKASLASDPNNPFLQGHVAALESIRHDAD